MLWDDNLDADCDLDSFAYVSRTRSLLRITGVVHLEIWRGGTHNSVHDWRTASNQRSHDLHQIVNSQHDRSASADCSFADGLLSCPGHCILSKFSPSGSVDMTILTVTRLS